MAADLARADERRRRLTALLDAGGTPEAVAAALAEQPDVARARIRPGLVKTNPPRVELVVDWEEEAGPVKSRAYDLVLQPDGRAVLHRDHEA